MMKTLIKRFQDSTIRTKLNISYLPLSLFFILFFALASFMIYKNSITERTLKSMEDNINLIIKGMDTLLYTTEDCADMLTINLNEAYEREEYFVNPMNPTRQFNLLSGILINAEIIFKGLDSIAFLDMEGNLYYSQIGMRDNRSKIADSPHLTELKSTKGNNIWFDMETRDYLVKDPSKPVLTLGKKIINIQTGETMGYLFITIDEKILSDVFTTQKIEYTLLNSENIIVSAADKNRLFTELPVAVSGRLPVNSGIIGYQNQTYAAASGVIEPLGWKIVGMGLLYEMTRDIRRIGLILLAILAALISALIITSQIISGLITNPIRELQKGLESIGKGSFDHRFRNTRPNELGSIARTFNRMSEQISRLMMKIEYEENKKREYELALIQEQVKPHFLYNSLDIILKLSQMKQYRKSERTISRLADYYKRSLSGGEEIITLEEEIRITRDYLELQKIRYSDLFTYDIRIDPNITGCSIPKLTLQPLVENSIYHGLKYGEKEGVIEITGSGSPEGDIILTVYDNGAGTDAEDLNALLRRKGIDSGHFGLTNVHHRLQLFFGIDYGLEVKSRKGEYTELIIRLPEGKSD